MADSDTFAQKADEHEDQAQVEREAAAAAEHAEEAKAQSDRATERAEAK